MVSEIATGRLSPMPLSISLTVSSEGLGDELASREAVNSQEAHGYGFN
jgi:hypothetical protein